MSPNEAKEWFTVERPVRAAVRVACRQDAEVIDQTPMADKDIDAVIKAKSDLIEVVHTLREVGSSNG